MEELDIPYGKKNNIHALVKSVQKGLKVHPDTISETKKGCETIVRILSSLTQIAVGIAELRNEYGIDHGRTQASFNFTPRHARLAIGTAHTYCCFLLDTLQQHQARSNQP